ncbi:Helix-loop-helix DNA-binding domain protein [Cooperia oncophora]
MTVAEVLSRRRETPNAKSHDRTLRRVIPSYPLHRRMSKLEILRGAIRYIALLKFLLNNGKADRLQRIAAR